MSGPLNEAPNPFAKKKEGDKPAVKDTKPVAAPAEGKVTDKGTGKKLPPFSKTKGEKPADGEKKPSPFGKKDGKAPVKGTQSANSKESAEKIEKGEKDKVRFHPNIPDLDESYITEGDTAEFTVDLVEEYLNELEALGEVLSIAGRMKKRAVMRKFRTKIRTKRARAVGRRASKDVIDHRARRMAVNTLRDRFSHGRTRDDLAVSEKQRIERMVAARKKLVTRMAGKMVRNVKQIERNRLQG